MMLSLDGFRHLFGLHSSPRQAGDPAHAEPELAEEQDQRPAPNDTSTHEPTAAEQEGGQTHRPGDERQRREERPAELGRLLSAYLGARAEEALALLLEGVARETTLEVRQAVDETGQSLSSGISELRDGLAASQREFTRIGREMVRSGATLESIKAEVAAIVPAMERLESSLLEQGERERAREEVELAGREEILATLDGLEMALEEGRELVRALGNAQTRLKDTTVQRWWRAMGEATGVKRPLPEVPLADLESLVRGLELTYRRLQDALARKGVTPIEAVGKPFDPHVHEAVGIEGCAQEQDGLVLREQRRGYRTTERILRLSQVVVGRGEPNKVNARRSRTQTGHAEQAMESDGVETRESSEPPALNENDK